jgi:fatty acid desaturase
MSETSSISSVSVQAKNGDRSEAWHVNPSKILTVQELGILNAKSNLQGALRLAGHLTIMGLSGYLWAAYLEHGLIALPALIIYGFSIAAMFAPLYECVHCTAFANNRLNFHAEHHLYASIPFHALPAAHEKLSPHLIHIDPGYIKVNQNILSNMGQLSA